MKSFLVLILILAATFRSGKAEEPTIWTPDMLVIGKLESMIPTVAKYGRFYTGVFVKGEQIIQGELIVPKEGMYLTVGAYIVASVRDLPLISDGGCEVIHLVYDVNTTRFLYFKCGGR